MSYNFNPRIDRDFIISMYEEDYPYIAEVFSTTYNQLEPELQLLKQTYFKNDLEATRRLVHKLKPAYGFVGLKEIEALCQDFENRCQTATTTSDLSASFHALMPALEEGCDIIKQEIEKLTAYKP
ncbi:MAG: hypothetical protein EOO00_00125 [Chitinophagaceae bacterium]|nr:MAG: hypothetical protein EOO00_00125 [Chitinophagaceae bacterium]